MIDAVPEAEAGAVDSAPRHPTLEPSPRMCYAIKGLFAGDFTSVHGAFLIVLDPQTLKVDHHHYHVIIIGDTEEVRIDIKEDWKSVEQAMIRAKLYGGIIRTMGEEIAQSMLRMVQDDIAVELGLSLRAGNLQDTKRILTDMVSKLIADSNVLLDASVEHMTLSDETIATPQSMSEEEAAGGVPSGRVSSTTVRIDPILAPVYGVHSRDLKPGMVIFAQVREIEGLKQNVQRLLATRHPGMAPGTVQGRVVSVAPAEFGRLSVICELGPGIIGAANISGELRIKTIETPSGKTTVSATAAAPGAAGVPTSFFAMGALMILALMALLAYLVFGLTN